LVRRDALDRHALGPSCRPLTTREELTFLATHTGFGTPLDITVAELSIEAFFPADAGTASFLGQESVPQPRGESWAMW
jgi:hypothetical protein